ncbi:MAG: DUF6477 family protein, partial [Silicimonas sp.]|nr:DUF6477 family protein [Silicimonas sp.]
MHDPKTYLASLRRPRLLVHAARHGAQDYRRNLCLRRLFPGEALPRPGCAFETLVEREAAMNHL